MHLSIMGSTGSVGRSAMSVVEHANASPDDSSFTIEALTANRDVDTLAQQAVAFGARLAVIADASLFSALKERLSGTGIEVGAGLDAVAEAAARPVDRTLAAIVGIAGLQSTYSALEAGNSVALANKESMVCAGPLLKRVAREKGVAIVPTDSEHNAMFQVMERLQDVERLILTASGGPFLNTPLNELDDVTPDQACEHPRWSMGRKISVDSATFMNKALELIEAAYLFEIPEDQIDVLVHPQSIIHSLVAYRDGSVLAQLGSPDMKTPIAHALSWPHRRLPTDVDRLSLADLGRLEFAEVDSRRFPSIDLARQTLREGAGASIVLNAANEVAVSAFLDGKCRFTEISRTVSRALESGLHASFPESGAPDIETIATLDQEARRLSETLIAQSGERTRSHAL